MTDALSGFLYPEESAAKEMQRRPGKPGPADPVSRAILTLLSTLGPKPITELVPLVAAAPRAVYSTIEKLERARLVQVSGNSSDEIVELTELGLKSIS